MHKVWLVLKREYRAQVMTKSFVITTIAIPLFIVGMIIFQALVNNSVPAHAEKIAILDLSGNLGPSVAQALAQKKLADGKPSYELEEVIEKPSDEAATRKRLDGMVRTKQIDGFLLIPAGALSGKNPEFLVNNPGVFETLDSINQAVSQSLITQRLRDQGVPARDLKSIVRDVDTNLVRVTAQGETEERGQTFGIAVGMAVILYAALLMYGIATMRSVLEEKTGRIMEILVSSVKPIYFMVGKILGIAAVALTQFLIWVIAATLLAGYGIAMAKSFNPALSGIKLHVSPVLLVYAVIYFVAGYLLFASLYAVVGATVSSEQDAQQVQMPITLVVVAGFMLFGVVMRDPGSTTSVLLSLFPFFSPILMTVRIALQTPPFWQIALSLALLAATTAAVVYGAAKIYRVGVLMYGKRPSLVEMLRWLRYS
jgi:ABC-2 type transport system permease protein